MAWHPSCKMVYCFWFVFGLIGIVKGDGMPSKHPPSCAPVHMVCVCKQHQNAKLLVTALPEQLDYKNLLSELVCNLNEKNCMLHSYSQHPGKPQLQKALEKILDDNDFDVDVSIKCKQWIHTDGTKLVDMQLLVSEFMDVFLEKFDLLRRHHFIAKAQSTKETLP